MSNCLHQSQPVETSMEQEEFPPLQMIGKAIELTQSVETAEKLMDKLALYMEHVEGQEFLNSLTVLNKLFAKGYSNLFTSKTEVQRKMMNHFSKLSKQLESNPQAEKKMLFILSLIAEMIKESPKFFFPFTRKFMLNVFQIDNQSLEKSLFRNQILAILAVIYNNLSLQGRLINKLNIGKELKNALLTNYYLINQLFTLKLFNRSVLNLTTRGVKFTAGEFSKHSILETISKFIAQTQVDMFLARMKSCMFQSRPETHNTQKLVI